MCRRPPGVRRPRGEQPYRLSPLAGEGQLLEPEPGRRVKAECHARSFVDPEPDLDALGDTVHCFPSPEW